MRSALVLLVMTACHFSEPAVDGHFKCDDLHACPNNAACVNGFCGGPAPDSNGGSGSGSADGVKCGAAGTCAPGMQCCVGPISAPVCQPAGTACNTNGAGAASCDGREDCGAAQVCCGQTAAACGASTCQQQVCQTADDCTVGSHNCCFDLGYLPWGICC